MKENGICELLRNLSQDGVPPRIDYGNGPIHRSTGLDGCAAISRGTFRRPCESGFSDASSEARR